MANEPHTGVIASFRLRSGERLFEASWAKFAERLSAAEERAVLEFGLSKAVSMLSVGDRERLDDWLNGGRDLDIDPASVVLNVVVNGTVEDLGLSLADRLSMLIKTKLDQVYKPIPLDEIVDTRKAVGGSANKVWKVTLKDNSQWVVKSESLAAKLTGKLFVISSQNKMEVAAFQIDQLMKLGMVPETSIVTLDGKEHVRQSWAKAETRPPWPRRRAPSSRRSCTSSSLRTCMGSTT